METVAPARAGRNAPKSRREQVEGSLKELEERRAKSVPLSVKIAQAGLTWSKRRFLITGAILGVLLTATRPEFMHKMLGPAMVETIERR